MAGGNPNNPAFGANFRDSMHRVFDIFAPPIEEEQATFFFPKQLVYATGTDADDVPFNRNALPVNPQAVPPVKVPCAVEYFDAMGSLTEFGVMIPSRAAITLLDEDYRKIDGSEVGTSHFSYVLLRGEKFVYRSTEYPDGLFDVGLYIVHVVAEEQR